MKRLLFFLTLLITQQLDAQDWLFGTSSNFTNEALDVKLDQDGNSISCGYISGHTNLKDTFLVATNGNSDVYLSKFDPLGQLIWSKKFGGTQSDKGIKVCIDHQNNILMTGYFFGSIYFDAINLQSINNSKDLFIVKLDPDGNVIWARREGGAFGENVYDITVDNQNNVLMTGQFEGISTIGNTTFVSQINSFTQDYSFDLFIAKFNSSGNPIWSKKANSQYEDRGMALTCDQNDNIYLTGQFSETLDFLGMNISNQIYNAAFISKLTPTGDVLYFKKFAGAMALPYGISLNANNEIYLTGDFLGNLIYFDSDQISQLSNPYIRRIFILKLTNDGHYIWGRSQGSNSEVSSRSIVIDPAQNVYVGGYFYCNFDQYRDSSGTTGLWNSVGFKDVFVSKFSPSGQLIWNKQNGGKKDDLCYALAINENDRPIYAGSYENNFVVPTVTLQLNQFDTIGVPQYYTTWPQRNFPLSDGNLNPNFKYYMLVGDDSKNSFVGKVLQQTTPDYYFYRGSQLTKPYLNPDLEPAVDILQTCLKDSILFNPYIDPEVGPGYSVLWNGNLDPDNNNYYNLTQDELIILTTHRWDNCSAFIDTINVQLYDKIPLRLTDDFGFNNLNLPRYDSIYLCYPDIATVTPSDLCPNCTFEVRHPDTSSFYHSGMTPFTVSAGKYFIRVYNEYGCMRQDTLHVYNYNNQPYDLIVPDLVLYDTIDFNDSLQICIGDTVLFFSTDSLINPNDLYTLTYNETWANEYWYETNFNEHIYRWPTWRTPWIHWAYFMPDSTGWYRIHYDYVLGYGNYCGVDLTPQSYVDSFYIEVQQVPIADVVLIQDSPICPGEINVIKAVPNIYDFSWEGPGITWQSDDKDSVQITTGGTYNYSGFVVNSENGCKVFKEFVINALEKSPPYLYTNPLDGVICPNEIVDIWIEEDGTYQWFGVNGSQIGTDSIIQAENQGFYYCLYTDLEGCAMVTQQVEVREFTSPTIDVYPDDVMCENETVFLTAIYFGVSDVHWQAPLNSSLSSIVVDQPGVYRCEITQCGITAMDSVIIIDGSFDLQLTSSQISLCYGDTATLSVASGYNLYLWNDLFAASNEIEIGSIGDYFVTVTNNFGCTQTSDTIHLIQFPESMLPNIPDSNICPGASITLTHNSPFDLIWYEDAQATIPIVEGTSISFTNVLEDTFVYAAYQSTNCPLAIETVMVNVIEPLQPPSLIGDSSICAGDSLYFVTPPNDSLSYSWFLNGNLISNEYSLIPGGSGGIYLDSNAFINLIVSDFCSSNSNSASILIVPKKDMDLNLESELLCPQNPLLLYSSPTFSGGLMWINGPEISYSDSLLIFLNQLNDNFIVAYGIDEYGCYSVSDTVDFIIPNLTHLSISQTGTDCEQSNIKLIANSDVENLTWTLPNQGSNFSDTLHIDSMNQASIGLYVLQATDDQYGCIMRDSVYLYNHPLPIFDVGNDTALCYFYSLNYQSPNLPYTFYWNGIQTNNYQTNQTEEIHVRAVSEFACEYVDSFHVYFSDCNPDGPNVITPDGDGINDYLIIKDAELWFNNCIIVLNRWGNVVYEDDYYQNTFNGYTNEGDRLHDGVYFYLFYTTCKDKHSIYYQGYLQILSGK